MIDYSVSDTSGYVGYSLYENGELLEKLSALEGGSDELEGSNSFSSSLRDLKLDDITNIWEFTKRFLVDQDAFDPAIDFAYFLGAWRADRPHSGNRFCIVNPGFTLVTASERVVSIPPIERIDYLALVKPREI